MNYFLNIGIQEDDLLVRMINSQEHVDLVQTAMMYHQMKQRFDAQHVELMRLKVGQKDKDLMVHNIRQLLHQKNQHIAKLNSQMGIKNHPNITTKNSTKK